LVLADRQEVKPVGRTSFEQRQAAVETDALELSPAVIEEYANALR
jgi:hypothetical protein